MNTWIEWLNHWGSRFTGFALPMLAQSAILIALLLTVNALLRKRVRATIRYALWILVLVKLFLPPTLTLPTSVVYWLPENALLQPFISENGSPADARTNIDLGQQGASSLKGRAVPASHRPSITLSALLFCGWLAGLAFLAFWVCWRSLLIVRMLDATIDSPDRLKVLLQSCRRQLGLTRPISVRLAPTASCPAICGLLKPVVLIPLSMPETLTESEMRSVFLHELAHYRRGDLWVSNVQIGLQLFYWYNPLLWLANNAIRRVREQAVDEMVLVEMKDAAEAYPATLVRVAQMAMARPAFSIGLVGILEPAGGLRERIDQMLERPFPRSARIGIRGLFTVALMGVVLLPMASKGTDAVTRSEQSGLQPKNQMNSMEMKHYENSEWHFAIDIPKSWNRVPIVPSNSPYEVDRFESKEDGTHGLIVFRNSIDPKQSPTEWVEDVKPVLARKGFGKFLIGKMAIGSRATLTLDFDKAGPPGNTWSVREYFIADGTLGYVLGLGTTNRAQMIDLYDRIAKSFQILE